MLDRLTSVAQAIGAVNTIFLRNGELVGDNTDAPGFLADLEQVFPADGRPVGRDRLAIVLGAGGAARAVVYALAQDGWRIHIAARRLSQAQELAAIVAQGATTSSLDAPSLGGPAQLAILVVNTTPVGMAPLVGDCPWPAGLPLPSKAFVYDLVYAPAETALMRLAHGNGHQAASGLGMLIEQAALAFEAWTGRDADREAMRQAVDLEPIQSSTGEG